jgi:hypothetical protein
MNKNRMINLKLYIRTFLIIIFSIALFGCTTHYTQPQSGPKATLTIPVPDFQYSGIHEIKVVNYANPATCTEPALVTVLAPGDKDKTISIPANNNFTFYIKESMAYSAYTSTLCEYVLTFNPTANINYFINTNYDKDTDKCNPQITTDENKSIPFQIRTFKTDSHGSKFLYGSGFGVVCTDQ